MTDETRFQFNVGESVMAYDKGKLYEAKVLKTTITANDTNCYFIHYLGWSRKYDIWLEESHICAKSDKTKMDLLTEGNKLGKKSISISKGSRKNSEVVIEPLKKK